MSPLKDTRFYNFPGLKPENYFGKGLFIPSIYEQKAPVLSGAFCFTSKNWVFFILPALGEQTRRPLV
jgi:hypothetical protein